MGRLISTSSPRFKKQLRQALLTLCSHCSICLVLSRQPSRTWRDWPRSELLCILFSSQATKSSHCFCFLISAHRHTVFATYLYDALAVVSLDPVTTA
eukprot:m.266477 g.266477  ORF g.266477 m.266477 type:complete len:97 (+) comp11065_c0_seq34:2307-2597(+)